MTDERTIDQWRKDVTPEEIQVDVCLDRALLAEFNRLADEYQEAQKAGAGLLTNEEAHALGVRLTELNEQIRADRAKHVFKFRKIPYARWRYLLSQHPATEEQQKRNPFADHDQETFAPAAIAESCVEPELTVEDVEWLREEALPVSEFERLYEAAFTVNRTGVQIPKSVSSIVDQLAYELKSTTAANGVSPSRSSEDE